MVVPATGSRIRALLGPTNTGKTYLAIERMLDHASGMIGFPLRLLARENYDRVVALKGARQVALVTGEEKIIPPTARYFLCTAESMPLDRLVEFLAIDEIQMCADQERGHVFTDRLLRARGIAETMLLGADTIRPILRRVVPEAEIVARPRFSKLSYAGSKKITRLPPRTAVVAFSAADVYAIAETLRRQRGGAAVVLGALSPRTRNAQVAMYQAGEVDYLVATDAIGMGLNMDIDHVAFAARNKFDGRRMRKLRPEEIAQIAGRAGRYMHDGTFGTLHELGPLEPEVVEAVENHRFTPLSSLSWRNADLDFTSVQRLIASLEAAPPASELFRAREADDQMALLALSRDTQITDMARAPAAVRTLWDVCQIPDFRKTMAEAHTRLLARIFRFLMIEGRIPGPWVADQLARLDRTDGDIDTLMARIAHVRTWTFVSHRVDWLDDAGHWQERARAIEDRLSDALHQRLTQRFVDRRATAIARARDRDSFTTAVAEAGSVTVEGEFVGRLDGFIFAPDRSGSGEDHRTLVAAANRALTSEIAARLARLVADPDDAFTLDGSGLIVWRGAPVARLVPGDAAFNPRVAPLVSDLVAPDQREKMRTRISEWLGRKIAAELGVLFGLRDAPLGGPARGLAFQLAENLGSLPRRAVQPLLAALSADNRAALAKLGVRIGMETVYIPALLKSAPVRLRALLWSVHRNNPNVPPLAEGRVSMPVERGAPPAYYEACGFRVIAGRAIRVDMLDRFAVRLARLARSGDFAATPELLSLLGVSAANAIPIIVALGYRSTEAEGATKFVRAERRREHRHDKRTGRRRDVAPADSPFAALGRLKRS